MYFGGAAEGQIRIARQSMVAFLLILEAMGMCAGKSSRQRMGLNLILIQLPLEMFKRELILQQYGVRDVSLQIGPSGVTEAQCAFKVADVNDDVLSLGRLLRRDFEFDLSIGLGCCMYPRGKPEKAVPLFLHNNSLRLEALPSVRAISYCRPVGTEMETSSSTAPVVRAYDERRRDEVHTDGVDIPSAPVEPLGPKSPLRALRAQLAELGRPTYGGKYQCWRRLRRAREARAEADATAKHEEAMAVGTADVRVPARLVEPLSEERERHNVSLLPPQPWCECCVRGRAPEGDHKRVSFERASYCVRFCLPEDESGI